MLRKVHRQTIYIPLHRAGLVHLRKRKKIKSSSTHFRRRTNLCRRNVNLPEQETQEYAFVDEAAYNLTLSETQGKHLGRCG